MKFKNMFICKEDASSLGFEEESKKFFIMVYIENSTLDYPEYYEIKKDEFDRLLINLDEMKKLAQKCRDQKNDENLIHPISLKGNREKLVFDEKSQNFKIVKK